MGGSGLPRPLGSCPCLPNRAQQAHHGQVRNEKGLGVLVACFAIGGGLAQGDLGRSEKATGEGRFAAARPRSRSALVSSLSTASRRA